MITTDTGRVVPFPDKRIPTCTGLRANSNGHFYASRVSVQVANLLDRQKLNAPLKVDDVKLSPASRRRNLQPIESQ